MMFKTLFIGSVGGNAKQRRRIVRRWKKNYIVRPYIYAGLFKVGVYTAA